MQKYVLGFLSNGEDSIVFVKKDRPIEQYGLLNGVGGKIEDGESPQGAMIREFREETGVDTIDLYWRQFAELKGEKFIVYCFSTESHSHWMRVHTTTSEEVVKLRVSEIDASRSISNLLWLAAMSLDKNEGRRFYGEIEYFDKT